MASFKPTLALLIICSLASSFVEACTAPAKYSLSTSCTWSEVTHPVDYPASSAHWSTLCGTTHGDKFSMYKLGETFQPNGMREIVETGSCDVLEEAISTCAGSNYCGGRMLAYPCSEFGSTCEFTGEVDVTCNYRYLSLASMVAPSPDWFIGFKINLWDSENGEWRKEYREDLFAKDGGTDSGTTFRSANSPTSPWTAVTQFDALDSSNIWWNPTAQKLYSPCSVTLKLL